MNKKITFKSKPLTLVGRRIKKGTSAPQFTATDAELKDVNLSHYGDSIKIITSFLSLDTPTCDLQVKEFNKKAHNLSDDIRVIGISQDLPFAQKRFCEANNIDKVTALSDYRNNSFGINYGLLIKEMHLLARSVLILDKNNTIRYIQVVQEASKPPDYEDVLESLKEVLKKPSIKVSQEILPNCIPNIDSKPPLTKERINYLCGILEDWELTPERTITKTFRFNDFIEARYFVDTVSIITEEQKHYPTIFIDYNKVIISLTTHVIGALSENDFIMAQIIDGLGGTNE
jgi:thioredoxin-dependent peroxiredoxin